MTVIAFLAVCAVGAIASQLARPYRRLGPAVGLAGLAAACMAALLISPTDSATAGDVRLAGSAYAGAFLAAATAACLLLCVVGLASGWTGRLLPMALAAFGGLGVALTATDAGVVLAAAAAAAATGGVVSVLSEPADREPDNRLSEARTLAVLVGSLLFASIAVSRPSWAAQDGPVFVLGFLGLGAALAVRSGSIPFHLPAANLGKRGASMAQALLLVWLPAGIGLMAVSWSAVTFGVNSDWLSAAVTAVQIVAVATLLLGGVGALLHSDISEIAVYSIIGDSAFILLALTARDAGAASPARLWLLVFVAAKTAFVAWAAATSQAFGSSDLGQLRGWIRRTPILGLALVAIAAATLGWPGSAVYQARSTLIDLGLPDRFAVLEAAAIVLSLAYYGRLVVVGLLSPGDTVRSATGERPRLSAVAIGGDLAAAVDGNLAAATEPAAATEAAPVRGSKTAGAPPAAASAAANASTAKPAITGSTEVVPTEDAQVPPPKRKRKSSRAAAAADAELQPTTIAPIEAAPAADSAAAASPKPSGPGLGSRLISAMRLNLTLEVSGAVLAAAVLSVAIASGGLGASNASRGGIPFETAAHATPTPTPRPTVPPPPTLAPTLTAPSSYYPVPSGSSNASSYPSSSPSPTRSPVVAPVPKN